MRRTAADAAETRRRLLDAALMILAERGAEGAGFEHIGSRIGMTRGAVHHHFPGGREELLGAVFAEQWGRYGDQVLAPLTGDDPDPAARLRAFLTGYLELVATDEVFQALVTATTLVAPRAVSRADGVEGHRRSLEVWRAALRAVVDRPGLLRAGISATTAVFVVVSVVLGINDTASIEPEQLPRTDADRAAVAAAVVSGLCRDADGAERRRS